MNMGLKAAMGAALVALATPGAANAAGLALEANGARAQGEWGGEVGAGYSFGGLGFSLRPMVGAFIDMGDDSDVKAYGRVEATYTFPLLAEVGAGVRFSSDKARPYATVSLPFIPTMRLKANVGPKYYALGLSFGL